jgi:S-formylglutathione hydrolase FrmB
MRSTPTPSTPDVSLSRRGLLLGGTLVLGAGCGEEPRARTPDSTATPRPVRSGTVAGVDWALALPAGSDGRGLPVVVALGGRGQSRHYLWHDLAIPRLLAASGQRLAVLAVAGGSSYWHPRRDGRDTGAVVLDQLLPRMGRHGLDVSRPAFLGWSMGGYGALLLASTLVGSDREVGPVAVSSPALWTSAGDSAPGAFDSAADFERYDVFERTRLLRRLALRIDIGDADPFLQSTRTLASEVGVQPHVSAGSHDAAYWTRVLPAQLRWLGARV